MAGYLIADQEVTDEGLFAEFTSGMLQLAEARNGKYLVRGGAAEIVAGDRTPHRVVIIEFESYEQARAFVNSPEYQRLADIRSRSSIANTIVVEGV